MHLVLHILKCLFEALTLLVCIGGAFAFVAASRTDDTDGGAGLDLVAEITTLLFFGTGAAFFFFMWWALVHFGHLPWWL